MERHVQSKSPFPSCLLLRIHSSFLLASGPGNTRNGDILFLPKDFTRCQAKDFDEKRVVQDDRIVSVEKTNGSSHIYATEEDKLGNTTKTTDGSSAPTITRFKYRASTTSPHRIIFQPPAEKLKDLGRRARARTEQERQNRKGIKVIDDSVLVSEKIPQQPKGKSFGLSGPALNLAASGSTRKRQRAPPRNSKSSRKKIANSSWIPDVSHIHIESSEGIRLSSYVHLHGLPVGSTLETVRRFFTGLVPERILVLLSNRTDIWTLDGSSYDSLALYDLDGQIYTNHDLRVMVKFSSIAAAKLAVERSGETILSKHINIQRTDPEEFTIGVTHVSKGMAFSLSRLAIDAHPGIALHKCVSDIESKLKPLVREILWSSAERSCSITVDDGIANSRVLLQEGQGSEQKLLSLSEYQKHAKHYNRLLRIQEDLMQDIPNDYDEAIEDEATVSQMDSIVRLTTHACMVTEEEMDRIDNMLQQYRALRLLLQR